MTKSVDDKWLQDTLETLSAEAFIFGNYALGKGVDMLLPDDNHELPPVEKAMQAITTHISQHYIPKDRLKEILDMQAKVMLEHNGRPDCKNCSLAEVITDTFYKELESNE